MTHAGSLLGRSVCAFDITLNVPAGTALLGGPYWVKGSTVPATGTTLSLKAIT